MSHTPGKWTAVKSNGYKSEECWDVEPLELSNGEDGRGLLKKDDALLIAAAPELLEALRELVEYNEKQFVTGEGIYTIPMDSVVGRAMSVIFKADGRF